MELTGGFTNLFRLGIGFAKLLVEIALMPLAGQFVLGLLAGAVARVFEGE